ncbi:MAG: MBL fold metallo-hydrolase [Acidobacteria bacterium]|nr:MBL fold metallo-hydrolase [Acidobacteriota bacterium]
MLLDVFPTGPIQANCILIGDPVGGQLAVIDPGDEPEMILERIEATGLTPVAILHTHAHVDHAGGTAGVAAGLGASVPIGLHREELELYENLAVQARMFGLEVDPPPPPTLWLEHGQRVPVGGLELEVRHTPGHSPGSVSFVVAGAAEPLVIVGDVLFAGSIGRTDLWGGSFEVLERSIREQLYTLPETTRVISGHGPVTTIGHEKRTNPFVRAE